MTKSNNQVMDASAILAYLQQEPGHKKVESLLLSGNCKISAVNLAEVLTKLIDRGVSPHDANAAISTLNLTPIFFNIEMARLTAELRPLTKLVGLSLGDRACLALAKLEHATVQTTDTAWANLTLPNLTIHVIR